MGFQKKGFIIIMAGALVSGFFRILKASFLKFLAA